MKKIDNEMVYPFLLETNRDPTDKDIYDKYTIWVSREYTPYRVFQGKDGKWIFIGKFYPKEK